MSSLLKKMNAHKEYLKKESIDALESVEKKEKAKEEEKKEKHRKKVRENIKKRELTDTKGLAESRKKETEKRRKRMKYLTEKYGYLVGIGTRKYEIFDENSGELKDEFVKAELLRCKMERDLDDKFPQFDMVKVRPVEGKGKKEMKKLT